MKSLAYNDSLKS